MPVLFDAVEELQKFLEPILGAFCLNIRTMLMIFSPEVCVVSRAE